MLMHEWLRYREEQLKEVEGTSEPAAIEKEPPSKAAQPPPEPSPAAASSASDAAERYADAQQIVAEVTERGDETQSRRLQALLARQQRLPLDIESSASDSTSGQGRVKQTREQLIERLLDPTLTVSETAALLGVCATTVRRYTKRGVLNCFRTPGNQRRFKLSDVLNFMEQQT